MTAAVLIGLLGLATTGIWATAWRREHGRRIAAETAARHAAARAARYQETNQRLRADLDQLTARTWQARDRQLPRRTAAQTTPDSPGRTYPAWTADDIHRATQAIREQPTYMRQPTTPDPRPEGEQ